MQKDIDQLIAETNVNFKRGITEMLILSLLSKKEQYAYELTKLLRQTSHGLFDVQGPSLYTVLYRLEQKGFISHRDEQVGHRIRVYYRILPEGTAFLRRVIEEYRSITRGITSVLDEAVLGE